jgi:uncharacterized membrane protein
MKIYEILRKMTSVIERDKEVQKVQKSYFNMMLYSIGVVLLSVAIAELFNAFYPLSNAWVMILECAGYVCWGTTLGSLGSKVLTWSETTPAEILDQKLSFLFSILGIFTFTMARALDPVAKS